MANEIKQLLDMGIIVKNNLNNGFKEMNRKFEAIDERFDQVYFRLNNIEIEIKTV